MSSNCKVKDDVGDRLSFRKEKDEKDKKRIEIST